MLHHTILTAQLPSGAVPTIALTVDLPQQDGYGVRIHRMGLLVQNDNAADVSRAMTAGIYLKSTAVLTASAGPLRKDAIAVGRFSPNLPAQLEIASGRERTAYMIILDDEMLLPEDFYIHVCSSDTWTGTGSVKAILLWEMVKMSDAQRAAYFERLS